MAQKIADVIDGPYKLGQPVGKDATLRSRLRRFMPAKAVDAKLRKTLGFAKGKLTSTPLLAISISMIKDKCISP